VPIKNSEGRLLPLPRNLKVCTMSADFWGLPTAGGTATAYGLLTSALSEDTSLDVSAPDPIHMPEHDTYDLQSQNMPVNVWACPPLAVEQLRMACQHQRPAKCPASM